MKNICERLLLPLEVLCKDFVNITYENASFCVLEDSKWLQLIYFLTTIAFWCVKYLFRINGDKSTIMENLRHCINLFQLKSNRRIKSGKNFPLNRAMPGLFFKNCSWHEVGHHPAKFGGHRYYSEKIITFLICYFWSKGHVAGVPQGKLPSCQVWWPQPLW